MAKSTCALNITEIHTQAMILMDDDIAQMVKELCCVRIGRHHGHRNAGAGYGDAKS